MTKKRLCVWDSAMEEYVEVVYTRCDFCGELFQVKKGSLLIDGFLTCYRHLSKEYLEKFKQCEVA